MLYTVTWLTDFAAFLLIFSVQRQVAEANSDPLLLGALGAVFSLASAVTSMLGGRGSDRFGKRRVALCGTIAVLVSLVSVLAFSSHRTVLFLAYITSGAALGTIYPSLIAWIGQGRTDRQESLAYLRFCISWNLGLVCGQWIGGWFYGYWGITGPLYLAIVLTMISFTCLLLTQETPLQLIDCQTNLETVSQNQPARQFARLAWIANFGGTFSGSILFFLAPHVIVDLNIPAGKHGLMLAAGRLVVIGTIFLMHKQPVWKYRFGISASAQILGIFCLIGMSMATSWIAFVVMIALLSVMQGFNYFASLTYSTTASSASQKGAASGWNEATLAMGLSGGALFGGLIGRSLGNRTPFLLAAGVIGLLLVFQLVRYQASVRSQHTTLPSAADD